MLLVTGDVVRVINHGDFHAYMHGLHQEKGPSFNTIVEKSFRYITTKETILKRIESDFTVIESKSQKFNNCLKIHEFFEKFKFEEFQATHDPADLESIRKLFDHFSTNDAQITRYIDGQI